MERKNVLFLSVIALATLIMTVVGTTFAYFSINVSGTGNSTNNKTEVTTAIIAGVKYEGTSVATADEVYPGWKGVQTFTIELPEDTPEEAKGTYKIKLTPNVPEEFGEDIVYELYKTTDPSSEKIERTEGTLSNEDGQVSKEDTLNFTGFTETDDAIKSGTLQGAEPIELETISYTGTLQKTTYYLVYKYTNKASEQNPAMGKTFSGTVNVEVSAK